MTDKRCVEKFPGIYYNEQQPRYWVANGKKYFNKFQALDNAETGRISFHVNDDEYKNASRQSYAINDLLIQRAKQLRENYDFIRIWYSGGKDSLTIIDSFLQAGCKINEIATIFTSPWGNNYSLSDIEYTVAEHDLRLRGLTRKKYKSNIEIYKKIYVDTEDFLKKISHGEVHLRTSRPNAAYTLWPETLKEHNSGMRVAEITGDQRPYVYKKNGRIWFYFLDTTLPHLGSPNTEDFYVSPDMPELMIAQARGISTYLDNNTINEQHWNAVAPTQKMPDLKSTIDFAQSYGRTIPSHDILISNVFGKTVNNIEYSNYKHQCAAEELKITDLGLQILDSYNRQVNHLHNRYQFDKYVFPVGNFTVFHALDSYETATKEEIMES